MSAQIALCHSPSMPCTCSSRLSPSRPSMTYCRRCICSESSNSCTNASTTAFHRCCVNTDDYHEISDCWSRTKVSIYWSFLKVVSFHPISWQLLLLHSLNGQHCQDNLGMQVTERQTIPVFHCCKRQRTWRWCQLNCKTHAYHLHLVSFKLSLPHTNTVFHAGQMSFFLPN